MGKTIKHQGRYRPEEMLDLSKNTADEIKTILSKGRNWDIKIIILPEELPVDLTVNQVANFPNLREVIWPKANKIEDYLFRDTKLKYITIKDCPVIGEYAFSYSMLTEITFPANLQIIGVGAFEFCKGLKKVDMSNLKNSINIPTDCFARTLALTEFNFDKVSCINANAFCESGIKSVEFNKNIILRSRAFTSSELRSINFNAQVNFEGHEHFIYCYSLSEVNFNNLVEKIPDKCFLKCNQLLTIKNTKSVKSIGNAALQQTQISSFDTDALKIIGNYAFALSKLNDITIPNSVTSIGHNAFFGCEELQSVSWSKSCKIIRKSVFEKCKKLKILKNFESVEIIGHEAFAYVPGDIYFENLKKMENDSFCLTSGKIDLRKTAINNCSTDIRDNILLPYFCY